MSQTLESNETSLLKNKINQDQQLNTQEYDKQVTDTYSVANKIDIGITDIIKIPFDGINFNFSNGTTQTTSTTDTVKAPSQRVNIFSY